MSYIVALTGFGFLMIAILGVGLIAYRVLTRRNRNYDHTHRLWSGWR